MCYGIYNTINSNYTNKMKMPSQMLKWKKENVLSNGRGSWGEVFYYTFMWDLNA